MMKDFLISAAILKYPDTSTPYTIFTDASKYSWTGVLTQEHTSVIDGKELTTNHPVSFVSGMFCGSQLNWAAMTKEAYTIYMTVKKSTFYLTGQEITLRGDHLPLTIGLSTIQLITGQLRLKASKSNLCILQARITFWQIHSAGSSTLTPMWNKNLS